MATDYPGAVDTTKLTNPATTDKTNSPSHAGLHANSNDAVKAVETKLGTGSSTPATSTLLFGTGAGTSAWQGLTSAQLAAVLSDETGTGSAVFATTPTLVTPKVDTINEATLSNGVTVAGLNIKSGALNTNNSVVTANITNAAVTANKLNLGLGTGSVTTSETTTSTTYVDLTTTTDTVTITVGANGLALILLNARLINSGVNATIVSFAASGANTIAAADTAAIVNGTGADNTESYHALLTGLVAGSTTFKMKYRVSGGTGTFINRRITAIPL